jgi:hypothetical protein
MKNVFKNLMLVPTFLNVTNVICTLGILLFLNSFAYSQQNVLDKPINGIRYKVDAFFLGTCVENQRGQSHTVYQWKYICKVINVTGKKIRFYGGNFTNPLNNAHFYNNNCLNLETGGGSIESGVLFPGNHYQTEMFGFTYTNVPPRPGYSFSSPSYEFVR